MKKIIQIICLSTLFFFTLNALASRKAITDEGDVVILKNNGTWKYESDLKKIKEITTNKTKFKRSADASFELKSGISDVSVFLNPNRWQFKKAGEGKASEYTFQTKDSLLYGQLITEKLNTSVENLASIALINAQKISPEAEIIKKEYRTVNNQKVIYQEMLVSTKGIEFTFYGYYFSNKAGSNQLVAYTTTKSLNKEVIQEIEDFLNGLSVLNDKKATNLNDSSESDTK